MARVTVEDCLKKISNRFELVLIANHRAKQIIDSKQARIDMEDSKPVTVALREIAEGVTDKSVLQEPIISEKSREQAWAEMSSNALAEMLLYGEDDVANNPLTAIAPSDDEDLESMKLGDTNVMTDLDFSNKEDE